MTERDDNVISPAAKRSRRRLLKTPCEKRSSLSGFSRLFALLITVLLFVGGSFSKITSEGNFTIPSLTAEKFDVDVDTGTYSEDDKNETQLLLYYFTIYNNSEFDITYDIKLEIKTISWFDDISAITYRLYEDEADENGDPIVMIDLNIWQELEAGKPFVYSSENDENWTEVVLSGGSSKTYVLI